MGGRERVEEGLSEEGREQGSKGAREGRTLQGRYPEESTGQCTQAEEGLSEEGREQGGRGAREGRKPQGRYPEEGTVYSQTIPPRGPWP